MTTRSAAIVLFLGLLLRGGLAGADAVGPPPESCPPGSTPSSSHSGPICFPTDACTEDAMCTGGASCMETRQCIETRACGGLLDPDAGPCTVSNVVGPCGAGNTCEVGECFTRHVCSTADITPGARPSGSCACAAGTRGASKAALFAALASIAVVGARARSRRARSRVLRS